MYNNNFNNNDFFYLHKKKKKKNSNLSSINLHKNTNLETSYTKTQSQIPTQIQEPPETQRMSCKAVAKGVCIP